MMNSEKKVFRNAAGRRLCEMLYLLFNIRRMLRKDTEHKSPDAAHKPNPGSVTTQEKMPPIPLPGTFTESCGQKFLCEIIYPTQRKFYLFLITSASVL
jgi:hypothetical protein